MAKCAYSTLGHLRVAGGAKPHAGLLQAWMVMKAWSLLPPVQNAGGGIYLGYHSGSTAALTHIAISHATAVSGQREG